MYALSNGLGPSLRFLAAWSSRPALLFKMVKSTLALAEKYHAQ